LIYEKTITLTAEDKTVK